MENLYEKRLLSQRTIYDAIKPAETFFARNSHAYYKEYARKKNEMVAEIEKDKEGEEKCKSRVCNLKIERKRMDKDKVHKKFRCENKKTKGNYVIIIIKNL